MTIWPFKLTSLPGRRRATPDQLSLLLLGAFVLIVPLFLRPSSTLAGTHTQLLLPPCLFFRLTTIPCPTCGMTTSFSLVAHGRLGLAFLAHPLGVPLYLYTAGLTLIMAGATLLRRAVHVAMQAPLLRIGLTLGAVWTLKLLVWYLVVQ